MILQVFNLVDSMILRVKPCLVAYSDEARLASQRTCSTAGRHERSPGCSAQGQGTGSVWIHCQLAQESGHASPWDEQVILAMPWWNEILLGVRKCGQFMTNRWLTALQQAIDTVLNANILQYVHIKWLFLNKTETIEPTDINFALWWLFASLLFWGGDEVSEPQLQLCCGLPHSLVYSALQHAACFTEVCCHCGPQALLLLGLYALLWETEVSTEIGRNFVVLGLQHCLVAGSPRKCVQACFVLLRLFQCVKQACCSTWYVR